jgi:hypothetical protein
MYRYHWYSCISNLSDQEVLGDFVGTLLLIISGVVFYWVLSPLKGGVANMFYCTYSLSIRLVITKPIEYVTCGGAAFCL